MNLIIGRTHRADIKIPAEKKNVSSEHARLIFDNGNVYIEDLGSLNGTYINGKKIEPNMAIRISPNDQINLANDYVLSWSVISEVLQNKKTNNQASTIPQKRENDSDQFHPEEKIKSIAGSSPDIEEINVQFAGFFARIFASIIDFPIKLLIATIFSLPTLFFGNPIAFPIATFSFYILITPFYTSYLQAMEKQGSLGQQVMGIKVWRTDFQKLSFSRALLRAYLYNLFGIFNIIILAHPEKQTLNDVICRTYVVQYKKRIKLQ